MANFISSSINSPSSTLDQTTSPSTPPVEIDPRFEKLFPKCRPKHQHQAVGNNGTNSHLNGLSSSSQSSSRHQQQQSHHANKRDRSLQQVHQRSGNQHRHHRTHHQHQQQHQELAASVTRILTQSQQGMHPVPNINGTSHRIHPPAVTTTTAAPADLHQQQQQNTYHSVAPVVANDQQQHGCNNYDLIPGHASQPSKHQYFHHQHLPAVNHHPPQVQQQQQQPKHRKQSRKKHRKIRSFAFSSDEDEEDEYDDIPVMEVMLPVFPSGHMTEVTRRPHPHHPADEEFGFENGHRPEDGMDTESTKSSEPGSLREGEADVARLIGNIPIALYEGSPRRYGLKQQPGHTQRILPLDGVNNGKTGITSQKPSDEKFNTGKSSQQTCGNPDDHFEDNLSHEDGHSQHRDMSCTDENSDELVRSIASMMTLSSSHLTDRDLPDHPIGHSGHSPLRENHSNSFLKSDEHEHEADCKAGSITCTDPDAESNDNEAGDKVLLLRHKFSVNGMQCPPPLIDTSSSSCSQSVVNGNLLPQSLFSSSSCNKQSPPSLNSHTHPDVVNSHTDAIIRIDSDSESSVKISNDRNRIHDFIDDRELQGQEFPLSSTSQRLNPETGDSADPVPFQGDETIRHQQQQNEQQSQQHHRNYIRDARTAGNEVISDLDPAFAAAREERDEGGQEQVAAVSVNSADVLPPASSSTSPVTSLSTSSSCHSSHAPALTAACGLVHGTFTFSTTSSGATIRTGSPATAASPTLISGSICHDHESSISTSVIPTPGSAARTEITTTAAVVTAGASASPPSSSTHHHHQQQQNTPPLSYAHQQQQQLQQSLHLQSTHQFNTDEPGKQLVHQQQLHQNLLLQQPPELLSDHQFNREEPAIISDPNISDCSGHNRSNNCTISPEVADCENGTGNVGDDESEFSLSPVSMINQMPVLEDGLSSGIPSSDSEYGDYDYHQESGTESVTNTPLVASVSSVNMKQQLHSHPHHHHHHQQQQHLLHQQQHHTSHQINASCSPRKVTELHHLQQQQSSSSSRKSKLHYLSSSSSGPEQPPHYPHRIQDAGGSEKQSLVPGAVHHHDHHHGEDCDTDQETDRLLGVQRSDEKSATTASASSSSMTATAVPYEGKSSPENSFSPTGKKKNHAATAASTGSNNNSGISSSSNNTSREVLIEGVLFRARYLGSTQLICEGQPTKATRMLQAEEAVSRIKAPEGEAQPSTEVDLFISTEKIMVLNTDLKEIVMDHSLRTISYIADIGDLLVLMARRRIAGSSSDEKAELSPSNSSSGNGGIAGGSSSSSSGNGSSSNMMKHRVPKMICHVFESEEAQFIAQSIGQAFQVAYMEFLKANGIEDSSFVKEMDYQEVLNSQEIFGDELEMFAKKDKQKEVIVPKQKGEILGMVIVESGWGSMLPTVVIANMAHGSPASRCGHLNIGDQIIAINGISLVGLPLSACQSYIRNTKTQTAIKLTVVPCPPVVEVKIKRPDTKYQLGFSVQNGVICSLLRGGIAERGGVRVGHRIIEINGQSVVAVPHERIVNLLATSVGEITMKTMPTSMYRLLTGQEAPAFI